MQNKNLLISLIIILIGLITFLGGYLIAQKNNLPQQANISTLGRFSSSNTKTQSKVEPKLLRLSTVKAINPYFSEDGKKILYTERGAGKVFAVDFSGQNNSFVKGEEASTLNSNISGATLSKNGKKMAYLFYDKNTGEGQISLANPDGSVFKNIFPTRAESLKINWISDNLLSFYNPSGEDHSVFLLNIDNKQLKKILDSYRGLRLSWSPDGTKLFYSYEEEGQTKSALLNLIDQVTLAIDLDTRADKCVWTGNSFYLYCGARREGDLSEKLYQLDVQKKEFGLIFEPSVAEPIEMTQPLLSPTEDLIFFVNGLDKYLYKISF